ncbi:hypothetical protein AVEN_175515-1 [Araneus ventricosus]|uniref:Uncharacterized protein n=1 Tax=Araneus ventricosus TaxID=182803 RepID=A0A4Y2X9T3_ARAVE|nr:hypothetical protein AVEN_126695-1 [Araneus ventricosus]GBO45976.1 hypothetical protein AVEN_60767-1 [Araneus ventricosus]GBO45977.1 hypothetical protein AVEN_167032-1 [Araneus ventricosus]GBO45978.1 hypothetical protein AVEN_175515-1 [Araneus ventricosus]
MPIFSNSTSARLLAPEFHFKLSETNFLLWFCMFADTWLETHQRAARKEWTKSLSIGEEMTEATSCSPPSSVLLTILIIDLVFKFLQSKTILVTGDVDISLDDSINLH